MSEEEEVVDQLGPIREQCGEDHCMQFKAKLEECTQRVNSKTKTEETCSDEMVDFMTCVDHCAMPKLFKVLK